MDAIGSHQDSGYVLHDMFRVRIPILNKWEYPERVFTEKDHSLYHDYIHPIVENHNAFLYTEFPQKEARLAVNHHPCKIFTRF